MKQKIGKNYLFKITMGILLLEKIMIEFRRKPDIIATMLQRYPLLEYSSCKKNSNTRGHLAGIGHLTLLTNSLNRKGLWNKGKD